MPCLYAPLKIKFVLYDMQQLRQSCRHKRRQLSQQQQFKHAQLATQKLLRSSWCQRPKKIALFLAQDGELSTKLLIKPLQSRGHKIYLPVLESLRGRSMVFAPYTEQTKFKPNQFGILEPYTPQKNHLTGNQLDLVLTPLTCFDNMGHRIGMGGGFYDKTFAFKRMFSHNKPKLIGWAHECQKVDNIYPQSWDISLDGLVTEAQLIKFSC